MSDALAYLAELDNKPVLFAQSFTQLPMVLGAAENERREGFDYALHAAAVFGFREMSPDKPFFFSKGLAVIPIMGVLLNRYNWVGSYASGYQAIRTLLNAAVDDPDVRGIVLDVNSYGGMVQGCFELADDIYAARQKKPILAVVDANAYSAGYALASSATKVVATRSAGVGSIGVVIMHVDYSGAMKEAKIKVTFIHAGEHKVDGNPYQPLSPEVKAALQAEVDDLRDEFAAMVARNRGLDEEMVKGTEAQTYRVEEALSLGLIDAVATPIDAVAAFIIELSGSFTTGAHAMAENTTQPGAQTETTPDPKATESAAQVVADAKKAERDRVAGIVNCEEAQGKSALANHLALNTELSVDDAKAIMKAAAPEASAAEPKKGANAFEKAMATGNPNVGADGGAEGSEAEQSPQVVSNRILANYAAATGNKYDTK